MTRFVRGEARGQSTLFPECLGRSLPGQFMRSSRSWVRKWPPLRLFRQRGLDRLLHRCHERFKLRLFPGPGILAMAKVASPSEVQ